ncbi:hypothetical protein [Clostridium sp. DL1XJH146]
MSENLICPLKFGSQYNKCTSNCAWNAGSEVKPLCAILKISFCLTSIVETNNELTVNSEQDDN